MKVILLSVLLVVAVSAAPRNLEDIVQPSAVLLPVPIYNEDKGPLILPELLLPEVSQSQDIPKPVVPKPVPCPVCVPKPVPSPPCVPKPVPSRPCVPKPVLTPVVEVPYETPDVIDKIYNYGVIQVNVQPREESENLKAMQSLFCKLMNCLGNSAQTSDQAA